MLFNITGYYLSKVCGQYIFFLLNIFIQQGSVKVIKKRVLQTYIDIQIYISVLNLLFMKKNPVKSIRL